MSSEVIGIVPEARLATALHVMASAGVRHLPVIAGEECLGVLLESDLIERIAIERTVASAALLTQVREVCRPAVVARPTSVRSHAAKQMVTSRTDAVLVADEGRIVGIVTASDLVRSIASIHPAREVDGAVKIGS
jgi:CBS domain-containing protein